MNRQGKRDIIVFILSLIICGATYVSSKVLLDAKSPEITIKNTNFKFGCTTKFEDLLNNAYATDDNLKDFYIENGDIDSIAESKDVKYVAIDTSGNVSKKTLKLNIDSDIYDYEISTKKDLKIQLNEEINYNDYFELKNKCGWTKKANFLLSDYDLGKEGSYEVVVSSLGAKDLALELTVADFKIPTIKLRKVDITLYDDEEFDFEYNILEVNDDTDSKEQLLETLKIDKDDLTKVGRHVVTYTISDSEGKKASAKLIVFVKERSTNDEERSSESETTDVETSSEVNNEGD